MARVIAATAALAVGATAQKYNLNADACLSASTSCRCVYPTHHPFWRGAGIDRKSVV